MKISKKTQYLVDRYKVRKNKFEEIVLFMEKNASVRIEYNKRWLGKITYGDVEAKAVLETLFKNAMSAAGAQNLGVSGEGCKAFHSYIKPLPLEARIEFSVFLSCFPDVNNISQLFKFLTGRKIKGFGPKKAALFMRDLYEIQLYKDIYVELEPINKNDLMIPLDAVISVMLNEILDLPKGSKEAENFTSVNEFVKIILGENAMIIEDLWFWGFFNTIGSKTDRQILFNEAKYYVDPVLGHSNSILKKIHEFREILLR